jgi:hypothetical protein
MASASPNNRDYSLVPTQLVRLDQWMVCGPKKAPIRVSDRVPGSKTDPKDWATFDAAVACVRNLTQKFEIGFCIQDGVLALDGDGCIDDHKQKQWYLAIKKGLPETYEEITPSGKGMRTIWAIDRADCPEKSLSAKEGHFDDHEGVEVFVKGSFITVTGNAVGKPAAPVTKLTKDQIDLLYSRGRSLGEKKNKPSGSKIEVVSRHDELNKLGYRMYRAGATPDEVETAIRTRNKGFGEPKDEKEIQRVLKDLAKDAQRGKITPEAEIDPDSWRDDSKSFDQLSAKPREFALSQVVPLKALTFLTGASFNGKTWIALAWGLAMATGKPWLRFHPPAMQKLKCIYHVPEMDEALVREYMYKLKFEAQIDSHILDREDFIVRPMESALWTLTDPRMLRSSQGRVVFLDTAGYFNPADDSANYAQAVAFAKLIQNLLNQGALAVVGLYHPPKYANNPSEIWTLENSVLGSAGYGGLLRSCIRVKNLNADLNDENVLIYCQGMKNPGLRPFQLQGPPPLKMLLYPSPYLSALMAAQKVANDPRAEEIFKDFATGMVNKALQEKHHISPNKLAALRKEWEVRKKAAESADNNTQGDLTPGEDFV